MSHQITVISPPDTLDAVHELMATVWRKSPEVGPQDQICFETALIELASNVFKHADDGGGISCTLTINISGDKLEALLRDSGEPGDIQLTGIAMPEDFAESGRGIPLIQALVHELSYAREGEHNVWKIVRELNRD